MVTPIPVLLVEDSPIAMMILKRLLEAAPDIKVVGTARNGLDALDLVPRLQPRVICTDYHMPKMDGLAFIEQVMRQFPRPILVISASVQPNEDETNVFNLLQAGAVDVFPKPKMANTLNYEALKQELIQKVRVLSGVTVFTRRSFKTTPTVPVSTLTPAAPVFSNLSSTQTVKAIVIGASTGGPQALYTVLSRLPANLSVPVVCVQHISEGFLQGLVNWLAAECRLPVKIAQAGEIPLPGVVYFAPETQHLEFNHQGQFVCQSAPPVDGHCPSVTALFRSAAKVYGRSLIGVLMTGMGRDGASGLQDIALAGGMTIAQDEQSSTVFGMPKEAIALGAAKYVLPLQDIPVMIERILARN